MATLRANTRVIGIMDPAWLGADFDPTDNAQLTPARLNSYIVDCLETWEITRNIDDLLFDDFKSDFASWTEEIFMKTDKTLRTILKDFLKDHGVYIGKTGTVSKALAEALRQDEYPEWPEDEVEKQVNAKRILFMSNRHNPGFDKAEPGSKEKTTKPAESTRKSARKETTEKAAKPTKSTRKTTATPDDDDEGSSSASDDSIGGKDTPVVDQVNSLTQFLANTDLTSAPYPVGTGRLLTELGKVYNDDKKFSGEKYDVLDAKLKIFFDLCDKIGIPEGLYHMVYSTMLRGEAEKHYYKHIARRGYTFKRMIIETKKFFHTPENEQMYLNEWRSTTYKEVIRANPDKDLAQCLTILLDKLQKIHTGLSADYKGDYNLTAQLANACQGVKACNIALMKRESTFESLKAELQSAVGLHMRSENVTPGQYLTSPAYYGQDYDYDAEDEVYDQHWVDGRYEGG